MINLAFSKSIFNASLSFYFIKYHNPFLWKHSFIRILTLFFTFQNLSLLQLPKVLLSRQQLSSAY